MTSTLQISSFIWLWMKIKLFFNMNWYKQEHIFDEYLIPGSDLHFYGRLSSREIEISDYETEDNFVTNNNPLLTATASFIFNPDQR